MSAGVDLAELGLMVRSDGVVVATKDLRDLTKAANDAEGASERLTKASERTSTANDRLAKSAERYGRILGRIATIGAVAMAGLTANSIRLAIAAEETASKFQVVFRGSVQEANQALIDMAATVPLTITEMRRFAAQIQDMLVPMGIAREEAAKLSVSTLQLAADIGSFNDVDTAQVLRDIQSALAGQIEPMRKYGVFLTQDRLKAIALEQGLIGLGEQMTTVAKAQATFIAITRDSSDAMGDAARTADSSANQARRMARDFKQAQEDLGQLLIPAFNQLLSKVNQVDDDGMTPLLRTMAVLSAGILRTTKYILLMVAGFLQLKNGVSQALDQVELKFMALKNSVDLIIADIAAGVNKLARLPGLALGVATPDLLPDLSVPQEELDARITELQQRAEELRALHADMDAETQKALEGIFATVMGIDAALEQLGSGVDRTLEDVRAGMGDAGKAAGEALEQMDPEAVAKLKKALEGLEGSINPTTKKLRQLEMIQADLDKAFNAGAISAREWERANALLDLSRSIEQMQEMDISVQQNLESSMAFVDGLIETEEQLDALLGSINPVAAQMKELAAMRELVNKAFREGVIESPEELDAWLEAIDKFEESVLGLSDTFERAMTEWYFALQDMAGLFERDSREAEALQTVITALNVVMGVHAVLKQLAEGDVYSAIPRALSVAAMVASMGVHTGASGSAASARSLQEAQGTGSVLGDADKKTESIVRATDITAKATSELVGINRGMLHALQNLQTGITNAVVRLARGGTGDFGALPEVFSFGDVLGGIPLLGGIGEWFGGVLDKLFGGSADLVDEGVRIMGGTLNELTAEVFAEAFRYVNVKKHIFDDTDLEQQFQTLGSEVTDQFELIFGSIRDTVREAAIALGIPLDDIEARIAAFEVATIEISFKDLTAEEQREELLAVFGKIFDDLARDVIPFIDQFQQVGEGLGETLVRVATSVQVFQEAIDALGLSVDESDPELLAQMAVGLVDLTGGVEQFISQFTTFFDKFASNEQKLEFATGQLSRAFEAVGLVIPDTRDGMIDLMMSLDATTASGREQIAMLLNIAGVADEYYSLLEAAEEDRLEAAEAAAAAAARLLEQARLVADFVGTSPPSQLTQLRDRFNEAMAAADALGASQREYAMIARSFNLQLQRMAAELTVSILSMAKRLFGSESQDLGDSVEDGLEEVRLVSNRLFEDWQRALEDIYEYTQALLLDKELTTLTPAQQFAEAQSQFNQILAAARAGDVEAAAALPDAAQALLEEARFMFASGAQYQQVFDSVLAALESVQMPSGIPEFIEQETGGGNEADTRTEQEKMWDRMIEKLERFLLATDLAMALRDLSMVLDTSVIKLADQLGIPLRELVTILGVELDNLTESTAEALGNVALLLGADVFELIDALEIGLRELATASGVSLDEMNKALVGELRRFSEMLGVDVLDLAAQLNLSIADLARTFGIGIKEFKASQFGALVQFSEALGKGVGDVAKELKINLGSIKDATSLLSEALDQAISELPDAIQADLGPLLVAIREATTASDASTAITNLGDYILGLPDDLSASLLPFLELIGFKEPAAELSALNSIDANTAATVQAINKVNSTLKQSVKNVNPRDFDDYIPPKYGPYAKLPQVKGSYQTGGYVPETGLYQLHRDEFVVNPSRNNITVMAPEDSATREELARVRAVLEDIREQNRRQHQESIVIARGIESSAKQQAEQQRRRANG